MPSILIGSSHCQEKSYIMYFSTRYTRLGGFSIQTGHLFVLFAVPVRFPLPPLDAAVDLLFSGCPSVFSCSDPVSWSF